MARKPKKKPEPPQIITTAEFRRWMKRLRDRDARARIAARIDRLHRGNPGDAKALKDGLFELRIDYGPGYRVYWIKHGDAFIVIIGGGTKKNQSADIENAKRIAQTWRDDHAD